MSFGHWLERLKAGITTTSRRNVAARKRAQLADRSHSIPVPLEILETRVLLSAFWQDSFEATAPEMASSGSNRTLNDPPHTGPAITDNFGGIVNNTANDYSIRDDGDATNTFGGVIDFTTGRDSSNLWRAEDTDGGTAPIIEWTGIDISGRSNLLFGGLFASRDDTSWEGSEFLRVEANVDGGGYSTIINFTPNGGGTTLALNGTGTALSPTLSEFTAPISSGNSLDLRVTFSSGGSEEMAFDNFRVGDNNDVSIAVATPEIEVSANTLQIADGDTTPRFADLTDFGDAEVTGEFYDHIFMITNSGSATLNLGSNAVTITGAGASHYSVQSQPATTVADSGGTTTFTIRFDPSATGVHNATINIANDDADESPFDFSITGEGRTDTTLFWNDDFEGTAPESPASGSNRNAKLHDSTTDGEIGTTDYSTRTTPGAALSGRATTVFTGASGSNVWRGEEVSDGDITVGDPAEIEWTGIDVSGITDLVFTGLFGAEIGEFAAGDYLKVAVNVDGGGYSEILSFSTNATSNTIGGAVANMLAQDGDQPLLTEAMATFRSGTGAISTGSSLDLRIQFRSTGGGDEFAFDNFILEGVVPVVPEIAVSGNAVDISDGDTTPDAADHTDFGLAQEGGQTVSRTFTITNSGGAVLTLGASAVSITGAGAGAYSVTSQPATTVPFGGGTTTFTIEFDPSSVATFDATVNINNDDGDENPFNFDITGDGIANAPEIDVTGNGMSIVDGDTTPDTADDTDFGNVTLGGSNANTFTVTNSGWATLNLDNGGPQVVISGADASQFSVTSDAASTVAINGGTTTFTIEYAPTVTGIHNATVMIANDDADEDPYTFDIIGYGRDTAIWTDDFESTAPSSGVRDLPNHTDNATEMTDGEIYADGDYFVRTSDPGDGVTNGFTDTFTNFQDSFYWRAEDIDAGGSGADPDQIDWTGIDISGRENLLFQGYFGGRGGGVYDTSDTIELFFQIDGGGYTKFLQFSENGSNNLALDSNQDGTGDGTVLTTALATFLAEIPGTGSTLDIRLVAASISGTEETAWDQFTIEGNVGVTTEVTLSGGTLTVTDTAGGDSDDALTISYAGGTYTITDTGGLLIDASSIAGSTGSGTSTVTVPDTGVTGIEFDALGGDDSVTVLGGSPGTFDLTINGGTGSDTVSFNTAATNLGGGALAVNADTVNVDEAVNTGGGNVTINAGAAVAFGASGSLTSGGGDVDITGLNMAPAMAAAMPVSPDANAMQTFTVAPNPTLSSFSVPAGSDRLLVVDLGNNIDDITAVTFGGTPLTQAVEVETGGTIVRSELWYLALGDSGSATVGDIDVTVANSQRISIAAASFTNVDQTTPVDGATSTTAGAPHTSSSLSVTSEANDLVLDSVYYQALGGDATTPTEGAGQTVSHAGPGVGAATAVGSSYESGAASVSMDWTLAGTNIFFSAHTALNINAVAPALTFTGDSTLSLAASASIDAGGGALNLTFDDIDLDAASSLAGSGALTIAPVDATTTIGLGGGSGDLNLSDAELATLTNGFSSITIGDMASGSGTVTVDSSAFLDDVTIAGGNINVTGAVTNNAAENITLLADGTLTVSSSITSTGSGAITGTTTAGIALTSGSSLTTVDGGVTLSANAAGAQLADFVGISANNATIQTTGTGDIQLSGYGSETGGDSSSRYGVNLHSGTTLSSTASGASAGTITIDGTGGDGTGSNFGVRMTGGSTSITSVDGAISITGTGGNGSSNQNSGIYMQLIGTISSTGTGPNAATITISGTESTGSGIGTNIFEGGTISTVDGAISISGTASADGGTGVLLDELTITSTGTGTDAGTIQVTGTDTTSRDGVQIYFSDLMSVDGAISIIGSSSAVFTHDTTIASTGTGPNAATITISGSDGVTVSAGSAVSSVDGAISIDGTSTATGGAALTGVELQASTVSSTGTGSDAATITINGTGGSGTLLNDGVLLDFSAGITSVDGNISVTGTGGNGSSNANNGIHLDRGAFISSTGIGPGAATITLNGSGGTGTSNNAGVDIDQTNSRVTSIDGDISIAGTGGNGSSSNNDGVSITSDGSGLLSTGTGANAASITINGTGGTGTTENNGVRLIGSTNRVESVDGAISITGTGGNGSGNNNRGVRLDSTTLVQTTTGPLEVTGTAVAGNSHGVSLGNSGRLVSIGSGEITITAAGNGTLADTNAGGTSSVIGDATHVGAGSAATGDITINADSIDWTGTVSVESDGALTIKPRTASTTIGLGSGAGTLNLDDTELGFLQDGFSSITIGDATSGDIDVDTATFNDSVTLVTSGEVHDAASGTDVTVGSGDTVTVDGTLAPGQSPGIAAIDGDFAFADGSTFEVEIGGTSPGTANTDHDQLSVTNGSVSIGTGVTLDLIDFNSFSGSVSAGDEFTIIDVVGAGESVTGTFAGLAEGAGITNFLGSGLAAAITYSGGTDNNDVVLTVQSPPTFSKVFSPDVIVVNQVSTLTFTIDNSASSLAATSLNFTDNLPAGVQIATPANASTTATGGTLTAVSGAGTISYTGGTVGAGLSAIVTVDVIATTDGVFLNTSGDLTSSLGNSGTASDTLTANIGDTGVTLSGGTLTITDVNGGSSNDDLTISYSGGTYTITDGGGLVLDASSIAGSTGSGTDTVTVPDTGVNGILFDVLGGDDDVTVDSVQASLSGNFTITGGTGTDTATINGDVATTGTGAINVTVSQNIVLGNGSSLTTVDGGVTLDANSAGTTAGNFIGVDANNATIQTTGTGNISLAGRGAMNGNVDTDQYGVRLHNGTAISSTATGATAGGISITGTAGDGTLNNFGVFIVNTSTSITTVDGAIAISGTGNGSTTNNYGVLVLDIATIASTGTGSQAGTISINGTGGNGTSVNYGVYLTGSNTDITTVDGDLTINGTGGDGSSNSNRGVEIVDIDTISSTGTGANAASITINGTGGDGGATNIGVSLVGATTDVTTNAGDLSITGIGGGNQSAGTNRGVMLESDAAAQVTSGNLTVMGTAGAGDSQGVRLSDSGGGQLRSAGSGNISITAIGSGSESDLLAGADSVIGGGTATGTITVNADTIAFSGSMDIQSTGALTVLPRTATATIGLGGGSGTLNLDDTELGFLQDGFSSITIGDAASGTGLVDIDSAAFSDNVNIYGGNIVVSGLDATGSDVDLQARTGHVTQDAVGLLIANDVSLVSLAGGIGSMGTPVTLSASSLTTDTSGAGHTQTISEDDSVSVTSLDAGSGLVNLTGGTFTLGSGTAISDSTSVDVQTGATLNVNGQTETLTQVTVSGGSLIGTGTLNAPVTASGGSVAPGNSPGIIATGDLDLGAGSTFDVELDSPYTTSGTDYDQLDVTGTVTLGATLNLSGGAVATSGGESVIIINNDGSDAVSGTFAGLAEGDPVSVGSFSGTITYQGGDGNDVALVVTGPYSVDGTSGDDDFEVRRIISGGADLIQTLRGGVVVDSRPADTVTMITINGSDGDDTLTVNYFGSGGFFTAPITFHGNGQTSGDDIVILGGSVDTVTHQFDNDNDGEFTVDLGGQSQTTTYTGLEPITDNLNATDRVFTFTGGAEAIMLSDDGDAGDGESFIDSDLGESVTFSDPSGSLTINAGSGSDSVTLTSLDSTFDADLTVNGDGTASGGAASFTIDGDVNAGSGNISIGTDGNGVQLTFSDGSLTTTGTVSIAVSDAIADMDTGDATDITAAGLLLSSGESIGGGNALDTDVDNLEVATARGLTISENDDLTIGGVDGGTNGISTTSSIDVTAGGSITVSEDVTTDAGTNGTLQLTGNITVDGGATVSAVDDDITLTANNDGDDDLTINGSVTADDDLTLSTSRDVLVTGLVQTVGNDDVDITSDDDDDGLGGFQLTAAGQVDSGGLMFISAASLFAIGGGTGPFVGLDIQDDGANPQLLAARSIIIGTTDFDTNNSLIQIDGLISSTTTIGQISIDSNGDVAFGANGDLSIPDGAINVAADDDLDGTGGVMMDDMTTFTAGGDVGIFAGEDVVLGSVQTTDDVEITSRLGSITDGGDTDVDISGGMLIIQAEVAVGSSGNALDTQVSSLAGAADSGGFFLENTGALSIITLMDSEGDDVIGVSIEDSVDGDPANDILITTSSPLTVSSDVINNSGGQITLQASDSAGAGDDLTIDAVTISAVSGNITLNVGDNLVMDPGAAVSTAGNIIVNLDFGDADSGTGTTTTFDGTFTGNSLTIAGNADADSIGASRISLGATINGGGGNDTITGTSGSDTIAGEAGDDDIDGRAGDDVFLWSDGDGSDVIEGGDDSDEIELVVGTVTDVDYIFVTNADGSIAVDGQTITYTGLEPIIDNLDAANRSFSYTGGAETITLSDDPTPGDGVSMIDSTLGELVMFAHPTNSLTIDAGDGEDTIDLAGLDATFAGTITVNGGADTDAVSVTGDIDANGGTISVGAAGDVEAVSFDGGALVTTGNVIVFSTGAIADNDAGNDVTANTVALGSGSGVGSGANALDTTVNALEADGGTGGVSISNTGDLAINDVNATLTGVIANGDIELASDGEIVTFEALDSNGGNVLLTAIDDVFVFSDVSSDGGNITFNSDSDGSGGGGIVVDGFFGSAIVTSSGGTIVLGGGADPTMNPAVATAFTGDQGVVVDDAELNADSGDIMIRGFSSLTEDGVDVSNAAVITTTSGNITIDGEATGDDDGVDFDSGSMVSTTSGNITITGTASGGTADEGVTIEDAGTLVTTESGQITITGTGDLGDGTQVTDGAVVSSTGTSAPGITLNGTATGTFEAGVLIGGTDAAVTSVSGPIQITGGNVNDLGVFIGVDALVSSTGTGATAATISIDGTGTFGVYVTDSSQAVSSVDGNITINGTSTDIEGVLIEDALVESTGTGANAANITISGTSTNTDGVVITGTGTVQSADGAVQITGDGGSLGISIDGSVLSGLGDITLTAPDSMATGDDIEIEAGGLVQSTGANVNIQSGDDVLVASGATVDAAGAVTIDGDFGDADAGTGTTIEIFGTLNTVSQGVIRGQGDNDTVTLDPDATAGTLQIDGQAGDDQYSIQLGNLGGQVDIDDQASAGNDTLSIAGTAGVDTVSVDASQTVANTTQVVTYTGDLETINVDGGDGADTFDVTPSTTAPVNILGSDPAMIPGDTLTYNAPAGEAVTFSPTDPDTGTISATGGFQDVSYDLIEGVTIDGAAGTTTLTVTGTTEDDTFAVDFSGSDSGTLDITIDADAMPGPTTNANVTFVNVQIVQINAGDGDDLLRVTDPADGVSGGLTFNGQGDDDAIVLVSGTATTLTHNFDNATDGSIDTDGAIINYTGLEPISDNIDANNRVFTFAATDDDITLSDLGGGMSRIESVSSSETVDFTNPTTTLTVNGGDGADTIDASALAFDATLNGGAGNDSLIGTTGFDQLNGDAGNDTLDGGTSNDTLSGGDDNDLIVWNDGDGSDQVDGDAGTDTLEVNASAASGDDFSIDPNGARFVLTRNNLTLFSLDVGTIETAELNTFGGNDIVTVGDLSGVSDLTTLDIDGGDDNDVIDLQSLAGGPVAQLDGGDGDDTVRASTGPEGGDGAADDLNLSINSMSGTLDYTVNATLVFQATPSAGDDQVIINGSSDDDALTLDFANGSPVAPGGTFFNGGGEQTGGDDLTLLNGTVTSVTHNFTNASDGTIEIEDGGTETITYTGLEPIFDNLSATDRIFNFGATDDAISLSDLGGGLSRIESVSSSETVDFVNPTGTLAVNADDGADTINYDSLATTAAVTLNAGDGTDTVNLLGTTAGSSTTVNGGLASDTVNVGSAGNSLDTILGDVTVNGDSHDAVPTVTLGANTLEQGDSLNINDQGNAVGVTYAIAATSATRTGAGSITYGTVESLNLNAGIGDDTVNVATTADSVNTTLNAGDGADTVSLTTTGATSSVSVNGDAGDDLISYAATGASSATEVDGGADNDTVTGTGSGDNVTILGGTGDDSLTGGSGDDSISGGDDSDVIRGGLGVDTLSGGNGDDVFVWNDGDGNDLVEGDDGTDRQIVNSADNAAEGDNITVSDNGARIDITRAAGTMLGTFTLDVGTTESIEVNSLAGDDTIDASGLTNGRMDVNAGDGIDTVTGGSQNDTLSGNGGGDSIDGGDGDDTIRGGAGSDTLNGQAGADLVEGQGSSGDRLTGETGDDTLDGGMGVDTVVETADQDFDLGDSSLVGMITGNDTLVEIEQALLTGGSSANIIDASDFNGSATLVGLAGNDTITGGSIVDLIYGGSGDDDISGLGGGDIIHGQGGNDSVLGGDGNDTIRGSGGRDTLRGDAGDDLVFGQGSSGDILQGGTGNDTLDGGAGNDRVFESADTDFVLIDGQLTGGTTGVDSLINIERAQLIGGASANSIDASGFSGFATLSGGAGDDSIIASAGGSFVNGDAGADSLFGSQVADTINGGDGDDTINAQDGNDVANGNDGNDLINGSLGADTVDGGAGDDRILGSTNQDYPTNPIQPLDLATVNNTDNDSLLGGDGNDTIVGALGSDFINGNAGADVIDVTSGGDAFDGIDTVMGDMLDAIFSDPTDLLI